MLHQLRQRYAAQAVYSGCGPVLVAVNPFEPLPDLYTPEVARRYSQRTGRPGVAPTGAEGDGSSSSGGGEPLAPHVFLTADRAYKQV